jgi:hypothetical protein
MANMMGAHGIWIKDGPVPDNGILCASSGSDCPEYLGMRANFELVHSKKVCIEKGLSSFLLRQGHVPPSP